ncbi:MAG TPA: class I SAM-dependent methyltransferase [Gammaproteobacteria bacterium]|nr:class I SAM-dependent methyltransferase [Gammaproteobacteria bacterium]
MDEAASHRQRAGELAALNRSFYDGLWSQARLVAPERFNTWPLVKVLAATAERRLEVAPGLRPRLPLAGTRFLDMSANAVAGLRARGAQATVGLIDAIPFADASFDLVCACDIVEHVEDDEAALRELARVAAPGATLLLSVPLHEEAWTPFDDLVGHYRRYAPGELAGKLDRHGFAVERSAVYGMQPKSSRLLDVGMWYLMHQRERAMWWYNRVIMPLGLRRQKPLRFRTGLIDDDGVDTVLVVCRRLAADS